MALSGLPRGGGDGDAIRMGILHIMRENGIREGHRPVSHVTTFPCSRLRPSQMKPTGPSIEGTHNGPLRALCCGYKPRRLMRIYTPPRCIFIMICSGFARERHEGHLS